MTADSMRGSILGGGIIRTALTLAWPVMLSNAFETVYNLTDAFWLGKLGPEAVAAPSISWPIMFLFISLSAGFGISGISLVSQYTGAGLPEKANKSAGQLLFVLLSSSCAAMILGFLFAGDILTLMGASQIVQATTTPYLQVMFLAMPFLFFHFGFRATLRGYGDTKTPMILTIASSVLDTALDPFFVFGWGPIPQMGVVGAALTTLMTRGLAAIIGMYLLFSGRLGIKLKLSDLKPDLSWMKKVVSIGVPSAIGLSGTALGFVVLISLVSIEDRLLPGEGILLAAYGIGSRLINFINIVLWGGVSAISTMVGQNLGANQNARAVETVKKLLLSFAILSVTGSAVIYFLRVPLYTLFISNLEVLDAGSTFITFFVFSVPFFTIFRMVSGVFEGAGNTRPSMILSLIRLWGLRTLLAYVFYFFLGMGAAGIWAGMAIGNVGAAALSVAWLSNGTWKRRVIEEEPRMIRPSAELST
ncbi:MAG: MATE family efflux transporter [Candidatus Bathyarchaeota archaeon]|nr:MATE family efflux transporter [Candidatus Bathyarchaeota archaeon]